MSGIAEVLLASGFEVSGSDLHRSPVVQRLEQLGARIFEGHSSSNLLRASCVVVSTAVKKDNPEWLEALKRSIPVIPRAEMLAELMRLKKGVAVAGSHGKTTTTSMLGQIARSIDATVVVGGRLQHWNASSVVGRGSTFIIEADESDRSFLKFSPVYSLITNIDLEHLDNYSDLEDIKNVFVEFLNRTAFFGMNWISSDCPRLSEIRSRIRKPVKTFGFHLDSDIRILSWKTKGQKCIFELGSKDFELGEFEIPVAGKHNVQNATGAIAMALTLGVGVRAIRKRLKEFVPADRRLQFHFQSESAAVIEDYAHHPTEIRAAIEAVKEIYPDQKIRIIFQPHRYSRTKALWRDFIECLKSPSQELFLLPVYGAHEPKELGVHSEALAKEIGPKAIAFESVDALRAHILTLSDRDCVWLVLGAAPLTTLATSIAELLKEANVQRAES